MPVCWANGRRRGETVIPLPSLPEDDNEGGLSDLSQYIYPPPVFSQDGADQLHAALTATNIAQPAIGACDLAMLELMAKFGVSPDMTAGHSYGEYVALHAAGVFTTNELLRLSAERGRS